MKKVFLLYSTDFWHSCNSKQLEGIFTTFNKAISTAKEMGFLKDEDVDSLLRIKQTQGRKMNFMIEEHDVNKTR